MPGSFRLRLSEQMIKVHPVMPASSGTVPTASTSGNPLSTILPAAENWGLSFQEEGKVPVGNASFDELQQYHAYYAQKTDKKVIYLTFDCGYENGNTQAILNALKRHNVQATFFVVGNFCVIIRSW